MTSWDDEADVVIAGYGVAGRCRGRGCPGRRRRAGARTHRIVGRRGGHGWRFHLPRRRHPCSKACGFDDSVDSMATFPERCDGAGCRRGADRGLLRGQCRSLRSGWSTAACRSRRSSSASPAGEPMGDQGLMYSGGENSARSTGSPHRRPRGHVPQMQNKKQGEASAGFMLMKPLVETATAAGPGRCMTFVPKSSSRTPTAAWWVYVPAATAPRSRCGPGAAWCWRWQLRLQRRHMVARYAPRIAGRPAASVEQHDGQAIPDGPGPGCRPCAYGRHRGRVVHRPTTVGPRHPGQ